jgi:uncharacterized protein (DUF433 family)
MDDLLWSDPEIMNGAPIFKGTQVPLQTLFDYLLGGKTLAQFLGDFPSVSREQALAVLEFGKNMLLEEVYENAAKVAAQSQNEQDDG